MDLGAHALWTQVHGNPDPVLTRTMAKQNSGYWEGGSVTVLRPDGSQMPFSPISGNGLAGPWAVAVDGDDNVWVSNFASDKFGIVELCGANPKAWPPGKKMGDAISPPGGYVGGGLQMQVDIDIDPAGNVWVSNNWQNIKAVSRSECRTPVHPRRRPGRGGLLWTGQAGAHAADRPGATAVSVSTWGRRFRPARCAARQSI